MSTVLRPPCGIFYDGTTEEEEEEEGSQRGKPLFLLLPHMSP